VPHVLSIDVAVMPLRSRAGFAAAVAGLIVAAGVALGLMRLGFGWGFALIPCLLYAVAVLLALGRVESLHRHARFGLANGITLVRLAGTSLYAGLAAELARDLPVTSTMLWGFAVFAALLLGLDGADGYLARRQGLASDFGARFDQEVDTLLLLLLSVLAFLLGKAGAWVLLIGTMRYLFVAAGRLWPPLRAPLPPSLRRSAICAVQGAVLLMLLTPTLAPPVSAWLAGGALLLLAWSFGVDVVWLAGQRGQPRGA